MIRDAEAHAEDDRRRREEAEVRNQADALAYQTEKLLTDQGDKLAGHERDQVDAALQDLKQALPGNDVGAIRSATERLAAASQTFTTRLYEQASASANASPPGGDSNDDDEVIDAEVV
jgi:molecular chaperone DnaK